MTCTCNSIRTEVNKYNSIAYGFDKSGTSSTGLKLNPDSCKHPLSILLSFQNTIVFCRADTDPLVVDCVKLYTSDWHVVNRR